jgi:predicted transcriptional regulator
MVLSDEEFREAYKPLQVPAHFDPADSQENKIIYALAQLGECTADTVIGELEKLESDIADKQFIAFTKTALSGLYDKGHLTGHEKDGTIYYNLHKITQANGGGVNPDLLAPGLD